MRWFGFAQKNRFGKVTPSRMGSISPIHRKAAMNYAYQKTDADCYRTTVSNLLQMPYEEVPGFLTGTKEGDDIQAKWDAFDEWLNSIGKVRIEFKVAYDKSIEAYKMDTLVAAKDVLCIFTLKKPYLWFSHAVLGAKKLKSLEIVFDPKRSSDYDLDDLTSIEYIFNIPEEIKDC